jgi:hypothetical protein
VNVNDAESLGHADLWRGESDAGRGIHRFDHVVDQAIEVRVEGGHGLGWLMEAWLTVADDRSKH